jgi:hypothetical protein
MDHYLDYKRTYTNCTYVDGNLEITFLDGPDDDYDLSFLQSIEEVSGYVLIYSVYAQDLHLISPLVSELGFELLATTKL